MALREDLRHALIEEDLRKIEVWTARHGVALAEWPDHAGRSVLQREHAGRCGARRETHRGDAAGVTIGYLISAASTAYGKKADVVARLDLRHVLVKFGKSVGLGQRRDDAGALARIFRALRCRRRRARRTTPARIRAGPFLLVSETRPHRRGTSGSRHRTGKPQQQRPHHAHERHERGDRISRQADERRAAAVRSRPSRPAGRA